MSGDPKYNPYRKKAEEQGIKNGWDFSDFMARPVEGEADKNLKVAQSLQTILQKNILPLIPHAPNFASYLSDAFGEGVRCTLVKNKELMNPNLFRDTYEILKDDKRVGIYYVWTRDKDVFYASAFEGKLPLGYTKLKYRRGRKDGHSEIPFP
jgi:hypothetical protein